MSLLNNLLFTMLAVCLMFFYWSSVAVEIIAVCAVLWSAGMGPWILALCAAGIWTQGFACFVYLKHWLTSRLSS